MSYPKSYNKLNVNKLVSNDTHLKDVCFENKINYGGVSFIGPLSGSIVESGAQGLVVCPGGTLTLLTINLPSNPCNGQVLAFSFTQGINNLKFSTVHSFANASNLSRAKAGSNHSIIFNNGKWFKLNGSGCECECESETVSPVLVDDSVVDDSVVDDSVVDDSPFE
jgi:hypothetical protein